MIAFALFLALVCVIFFVPLSWLERVRATAGRLWRVVAGKRAPSTASRETAVSGDAGAIAGEEVRPACTNKPTLATAAKNVAGAFASVIAFVARNPRLCLVLFCVGLYLIAFGFNLPFGLGKSKAELRLEAAQAEARAEFEALRAEFNGWAAKRGDKTQERERAIEHAVSTGQQEIANVAPQDFDALHDVYERVYRGVYANDPDAPHGNPAPRGTDPMRGADRDAA